MATRPATAPAAAPITLALPVSAQLANIQLRAAAAAAVFVGAPPGEQDAADAMAAAYDLTPAETRVLATLLAGRTLAETAGTLGIAPTTAKTHLDRIFGKTGVSRQSELLLLATRIASPARATT